LDLRREVPASSLVVAIDPGKAFNRVWLTSGQRGMIGEPVSLPVLREGVDQLRDALMGIAWGLSQSSDAFRTRDAELRARGFRPIEARVAMARSACRLLLATPSIPTPIRRSALRSRSAAQTVTALLAMPHDGAT